MHKRTFFFLPNASTLFDGLFFPLVCMYMSSIKWLKSLNFNSNQIHIDKYNYVNETYSWSTSNTCIIFRGNTYKITGHMIHVLTYWFIPTQHIWPLIKGTMHEEAIGHSVLVVKYLKKLCIDTNQHPYQPCTKNKQLHGVVCFFIHVHK